MDSLKGKIAIVGSGLIGRGWAMLFAAGGFSVSIYDVDQNQVTRAMEDIQQQLEKQESRGLLRGKFNAKEQLSFIKPSTDLKDCVSGAIHVQEAIPENADLKKKVFVQLDETVSEGTVLSSSTSAVPASVISEGLKYKSQCIVSHPVNPPRHMPLVELVPAPWTSPEVVSRTYELMTDIGQTPVILKKEVMGFVQNRIQQALVQECVKLVLDDVISVKDVDKVVLHGLARRYAFMGPFETIHLNADGTQSYLDRYADMMYNVSLASGSDVVPMFDNPAMEKVFKQLEELSPLDKMKDKRNWRDNGIARLHEMRTKMNAETGN